MQTGGRQVSENSQKSDRRQEQGKRASQSIGLLSRYVLNMDINTLVNPLTALLLASWFCAQCVARLAQGMAISLLELSTFGHALCAILMYILWWHKPLDV